MKRTIEIEFETRCKKDSTAIKRFFKAHPEMTEWQEVVEWMLANSIQFYCNDTLADGSRCDDWTYAIHVDVNDDCYYFCIIIREAEETETETATEETEAEASKEDMKRVNEKIRELKKELAELDRLTELADIADREYEQNPESKKAEAQFDRAYKKEWGPVHEVLRNGFCSYRSR